MAKQQERDRNAKWRDHNFYEVLGLSASATQAEVKKGFKKSALTCHPDKVPEKERERATKRFQLIAEAYEVLSNERTRFQYDEISGFGGRNIREKPSQTRAPAPQPAKPATKPSTPGYNFNVPTPPGGYSYGATGANKSTAAAATAAAAAAAARKPGPGMSPFSFAGPRCEGCDRRCPIIDVRNCPQCDKRGLLSSICPACTECAACCGGDYDVKPAKKAPQARAAAGSNAAKASASKDAPRPSATPSPGAAPKRADAQPAPQANRPEEPAAQRAGAAKEAGNRASASAFVDAWANIDAERPQRKQQEPTPPPVQERPAPPGQERVASPQRPAPAAKADDEGPAARRPPASVQPWADTNGIGAVLLAMGYVEDDAKAAALRCSSVEAAIEFLAARGCDGDAGAADGTEAVGAAATPTPADEAEAQEAADEDVLDMVGILRALGFPESDARRACERCSSVEAAVEYIMTHEAVRSDAVADAVPPVKQPDATPAGPAPPATLVPPVTEAPRLIEMPGLIEVWEKIVAPSPASDAATADNKARAQLHESLLSLGFGEAQVQAAVRRCSSLEAAVDWIMKHPEAT